MDTEQDFEEFAKRYPELMAKSRQDYIGVGKGWYSILNVLFGLLSRDVAQAKYQLKYALEHPESKYVKPIAELEANLATALDQLPVIQQIKEKFGSLRFYVDGGTNAHHAYISFAESMSYNTCEVCGSRGEARNDGWTKVLCEHHHRERQQQNSDFASPRKVSSPKSYEE